MSKRRFIQAVVVRTLPALDKLPECIRYAESVWDSLTRHGYGTEAASQPRESKDWFAALNTAQQAGFRQFWDAFNYKKGRNDAAMRWHQLGELSSDETKHIVEAARKEALRALPPGQVRKMASGWLFEKRWLDHQMQPVVNRNSKIVELSRLKNELSTLEKLHASKPHDTLAKQIDTLKQRMHNLQAAP